MLKFSVKEQKNALKFFIDEETHAVDHDLNGLLGFTLATSYDFIDEHFIMMGNGAILGYDSDHFDDCLRIKTEDLSRQLAPHQLHDKFIFGTTIKFDLIEQLVPK